MAFGTARVRRRVGRSGSGCCTVRGTERVRYEARGPECGPVGGSNSHRTMDHVRNHHPDGTRQGRVTEQAFARARDSTEAETNRIGGHCRELGPESDIGSESGRRVRVWSAPGRRSGSQRIDGCRATFSSPIGM